MWIALLKALAALPGLFSYLDRFSEWFSREIDLIKKRQALEAAQKALDKAKKEKDTSALDDLFGGRK